VTQDLGYIGTVLFKYLVILGSTINTRIGLIGTLQNLNIIIPEKFNAYQGA